MKQRELPGKAALDDGISAPLREYISRRDIARFYDDYFRGMGLFDFDTRVLDVLFEKPGRLLDLGCGTGRHLVHFARRGFDVTGVDLSDHMLDMAGSKAKDAGVDVRLVRASFCDLGGLDSASFDYVICMFSTLGMVRGSENRAAALAEVRRLLVPGGAFAIHAHNRLHNLWIPGGTARLLRSYLAALVGRREVGDMIIDGYRGVKRMYLHSYTARELREAISAAGLEVSNLLHLNERRDGLIRRRMLSGLLANGFIAIAGKPTDGKQ